MAQAQSSWLDLFRGENGLRVAVLSGGVGLHAVNVFIGSTLLPSVVEDIGGLDLFAWNTTLFIVASIVASIFAATRPFGIGPRAYYVLATVAFALGSLACGAAPNMPVMLVGRMVQGFGAGMLVAMTHAMIRVVFAPALWPRAMALISGVWGVATLIGPAAGGVFAEYGLWRWAFWVLVPFAGLLGLLAFRVIPARGDEKGAARVPVIQIAMLISAVLLASVASFAAVTNLTFALQLVGLAIAAFIALAVAEKRSGRHLLPTGTFSLSSRLSPLLAAMLLMQFALTADIFVPLFLQRIHGQPPLLAGYLVALIAMGWTIASLITSGWTGARAERLLGLAPAVMGLSMIATGLALSRVNPGADWLVLTPVVISLLFIGFGIGAVWPHLMTRVLHAAPEGEKDRTAAAITMVQLFSSGFGAAIAGVLVNVLGVVTAKEPAEFAPAALWLMVIFGVIPLLAAPFAVVAGRRTPVAQPGLAE